MSKLDRNKSVIFQAKTGAIELRGDFNKETIWATLEEIAMIFGRDKSVISRHLTNIYHAGELDEQATVAKNATVQLEGTRKVERVLEYYNLDAIISVGYRVNSVMATKFRQWATKVLRQHITNGFSINPKVVRKNYTEFQTAIENLKCLLPEGSTIDNASVLELISAFADTWVSLSAYDKETLVSKGATKRSVTLTSEQLAAALAEFKTKLMEQGEATELFGRERSTGSIQGIVGNVMQSFGGHGVYPSIEEKAAHLLYFLVKNHPFTDGNKRSGAYAFVWFLSRTRILAKSKITPPALTALTLFIAESDPRHKEKMIRLVLQLLR